MNPSNLYFTKILSLKKKSYLFQQNIINVINSYSLLQQDDGVIVAVSGGSDSICLLRVLSRLSMDLRLRVVYVDHSLRPQETPQEIELIQMFCARLGVNFTIKTVDVKRLAEDGKMSIEEAARFLRYQALEEERLYHSFDKIAVGHHADDQVEEFFIRLFRGSGTTGLAGMHLTKDAIIRPLLFETKNSIEQYLTNEEVPWATDSSNFELDFLRNKIRHNLLPSLEQTYNPRIRHTVQRTMSVLQEEDDFLTSLSEEKYSCCVEETFNGSESTQVFSISLQNDKYLSYHLAVRRRIVEKICWKMSSRPSYIIIDDIDRLVQTAETGKELHLSNGLRVRKKQKSVCFSHPPLTEKKRGTYKAPEPYEIAINGTGHYPIPGTTIAIDLAEAVPSKNQNLEQFGLKIDLDMVVFPIIIRGVRPGERFTPYNGVGSKKVLRYLNDQKLDKHKRSSWPILFSGNSLVAIVGYTIGHQFRVTDKTKRVLHISYKDDSNK
ncbi:MAG: tRNA(Ile)-lysidine synthase [Desulforhopalus sp.]